MNKILLFLTALTLFLSCSKKEDNCQSSKKPVAKFEYSRYRCGDNSFLCVQFQNTSDMTDENPKFNWLFGDGDESGQENPTHHYDFTGTYNIVLKVTNCNGNISYATDTIEIL